jgi:hypothetical protein
MHVFTSITSNYVPKARVLANSVKRVHPKAFFHLVCADSLLGVPPTDLAVFDSILTLDDLSIPNPRSWAFKHSLVELCTAVKGVAAREIIRRFRADRVYFFDPDIVVLAPLDDLQARLEQHSILLTPHQTVPDQDEPAIVDNEICSLIHGVFNMGFLAVRATDEGQRFLHWWAERLLHFCYDDKPGGLFTDQRWVDLAPCFFTDLEIVRDPQYNVATWNLSQRRADGKAPYEIAIEGKPLAFYHFSGLDSGAQEIMLARYGAHSPVLLDLRRWYLEECERMGQSHYGNRPCIYNTYSDGTAIPLAHRQIYRSRGDLQKAYPDPYAVQDPERSFLNWYRVFVEHPAATAAQREQAWERSKAQAKATERTILELAAIVKQQEVDLQMLQRKLKAIEAEVAALQLPWHHRMLANWNPTRRSKSQTFGASQSAA